MFAPGRTDARRDTAALVVGYAPADHIYEGFLLVERQAVDQVDQVGEWSGVRGHE
jgi:hypothetical protein